MVDDVFLTGFDERIQSIVLHARELFLASIPGVVETRDIENLGFGIAPGYRGLIFTITPHRDHVTLGIAEAVDLPDAEGLLQGSGKHHRHVKLWDTADLDAPALRALISAAVARKLHLE